MSFNHYYQSELTALRELGRRFAERSPALAPYLGQAGRDPDVERLLEGFAFLTGRLRQKLDDELPELSHSLMQLLWPNYMRPLPAFSILQFDPLKRAGPALVVERDTPVESEPVEDVPCRFRTCYATDVLPLRLAALNYSVKGDGSLLSLRLEMSADGHLGELELSTLRLHFAGERYISQMLYLSLLSNLEGIELIPLDGAGKPIDGVSGKPMAFKIPGDRVKPVGFAEEEALIPYPLNTFRGYRYLQEYFAFQDKFLFVDVNGLDILKALPQDTLKLMRGLELRFDIRKSGIMRMRPTLENPTRNFLDLFHHRLQRLMLPIWKKYRYRASFESGANDPFSAQLFALIGLGGEEIRRATELNWKRLLPYLGLLSLRAHSAALIEAVLRYYFKHAELIIEQCIERRVEILEEQRNCLGLANTVLGESLVLGESVRDRSGKFRIHIRELDWQRFHEFLPIGFGYQPLCALVRFTLRDPLDYDIRLVLRHEEIRELRIGEQNACRLGWTSWLGREHADGVVTLGSKIH
ncbi:type VI secretion system ImpH/TssG family protein [Pseudomonas laurylsulfativorans]|nr:type VI secretion system ImpH/TssG family protein [Pseudomonas laurylsulfativorans]